MGTGPCELRTFFFARSTGCVTIALPSLSRQFAQASPVLTEQPSLPTSTTLSSPSGILRQICGKVTVRAKVTPFGIEEMGTVSRGAHCKGGSYGFESFDVFECNGRPTLSSSQRLTASPDHLTSTQETGEGSNRNAKIGSMR